jgi:hypothetical protein
MVKWFKLTRNQYFGFFAPGLLFFALQELPYIVMQFIPLSSNVLMEMQDKSPLLNMSEKILGVSCILTLLFLVREDANRFSLSTLKEKVYFGIAMAAIAGYFIGWVFYFGGHQTLPLIICSLVAMPPIYYSFIGLWRKNYPLAAIGAMFLIAHILNVWNNLT